MICSEVSSILSALMIEGLTGESLLKTEHGFCGKGTIPLTVIKQGREIRYENITAAECGAQIARAILEGNRIR